MYYILLNIPTLSINDKANQMKWYLAEPPTYLPTYPLSPYLPPPYLPPPYPPPSLLTQCINTKQYGVCNLYGKVICKIP